jgi:hypothetical protein
MAIAFVQELHLMQETEVAVFLFLECKINVGSLSTLAGQDFCPQHIDFHATLMMLCKIPSWETLLTCITKSFSCLAALPQCIWHALRVEVLQEQLCSHNSQLLQLQLPLLENLGWL